LVHRRAALGAAGAPHWSDHLPQAFRQRWGYDLLDHLASLHLPVGDWKRVRHNYFQLLLEQFIERWAKPCYEYCERHNLEFTGHYWEHGWPDASHGGDNMAMYAWHQRPAIDNLMNQYSEDVNGQFGNARTVKELSSVANQLGRRRTLCEAYGAGGWDLRFEDMKRIGDWLVVLGVNTLNEHLSYITIRGTRKRDHPQSFSYHTPWWDDYHVMADYFTRLSAATSHGQQINRILVLQPTTAAWMYQPDPSTRDAMMDIGRQFQDLSNALERAQVEYDIGCEDIMARHGSVAAGDTAGAGGRPAGLPHGGAPAPYRKPERTDRQVAGAVRRRRWPRAVRRGNASTRRRQQLGSSAAAGGSARLAVGRSRTVAPEAVGIEHRRLRHPARGRRSGHPVPHAPDAGRRPVAADGQYQHRTAQPGSR
jgi:hypothetical protein